MMTMTRNAVCLIEGDSINDPALFYIAFAGLKATVDSFYMAPSGTSYRRPAWVNKAFTGSTTTTVAGRLATELAANAYTNVFIHIGINDADTGVALATSQTNCNTIKAACASAGVQLLVVGPLCFGEKWPTGQNVNDTAIDALDVAMAAIFAGANNTYVSARTGIYAIQEPISNTPGPGVAQNILTHIDGGGKGLHCNPGGAPFYTKLVTPLVSLG